MTLEQKNCSREARCRVTTIIIEMDLCFDEMDDWFFLFEVSSIPENSLDFILL